MSQVGGPSQLPPETWVHVFGFMSKAEKQTIRLCCKYFKRLVDHWSLWKEDTVVLKKQGGYNDQFWCTLRRRRTTRVKVQNACSIEWRLATLDSVTTIAIVGGFDRVSLESLINTFPALRSLALRDGRFPLHLVDVIHPLEAIGRRINIHRQEAIGRIRRIHQEEANRRRKLIYQQLTNLSLCKVSDTAQTDIHQFTNLTSLSFHMGPLHKDKFHDMLFHLPHLKHLSLKMGRLDRLGRTLPDDYLSPEEQRTPSGDCLMGPSLTSLELLDYMDPCLSSRAFAGLACLRSLALSYRDTDCYPSHCSHLAMWLTSLPQLTVLSITRGPVVRQYSHFVPGSLTSLTLRTKVQLYELVDLTGLATRVPGLRHLHLDHLYGARSIGAIPNLFPELRTIKIRHQGVPESDLLNLQQLQHLERLEILDGLAEPSAVLLELQAQTRHRIHLVHSPTPLDPMTCDCHL